MGKVFSKRMVRGMDPNTGWPYREQYLYLFQGRLWRTKRFDKIKPVYHGGIKEDPRNDLPFVEPSRWTKEQLANANDPDRWNYYWQHYGDVPLKSVPPPSRWRTFWSWVIAIVTCPVWLPALLLIGIPLYLSMGDD